MAESSVVKPKERNFHPFVSDYRPPSAITFLMPDRQAMEDMLSIQVDSDEAVRRLTWGARLTTMSVTLPLTYSSHVTTS